MRKRLKNMEITAIALVGKPANRRKFLLFKSEQGGDMAEVDISKPYSGPNDSGLPENIKRLSEDKRKAWVKAFESAWENYSREKDKHYDEDKTLKQNKERFCFAIASAAANRVGKENEQIEKDIDSIIGAWTTWAGSWTRCVEVLSGNPKIATPEAPCAWLHHEAEGVWPGEKSAQIAKPIARKPNTEEIEIISAIVRRILNDKRRAKEEGGDMSKEKVHTTKTIDPDALNEMIASLTSIVEKLTALLEETKPEEEEEETSEKSEVEKKGAMLSAVNKTLIQQVIDSLQKLLAATDAEVSQKHPDVSKKEVEELQVKAESLVTVETFKEMLDNKVKEVA